MPQREAERCCISVSERNAGPPPSPVCPSFTACDSACFDDEFVNAPDTYHTRMNSPVIGVMKAIAPVARAIPGHTPESPKLFSVKPPAGFIDDRSSSADACFSGTLRSASDAVASSSSRERAELLPL